MSGSGASRRTFDMGVGIGFGDEWIQTWTGERGGNGGNEIRIDNRIRSGAIIVHSVESIIDNRHREMDYQCFE